MAGVGVDPSQITTVSGTYKDEGDAIIQLPSKVQTSIGSGQVGRHFANVAGPYQQVYQRLGDILKNMGNKVLETGVALGQTATDYSHTDDSNAQNLQGVD